jgi:hypothetical protein
VRHLPKRFNNLGTSHEAIEVALVTKLRTALEDGMLGDDDVEALELDARCRFEQPLELAREPDRHLIREPAVDLFSRRAQRCSQAAFVVAVGLQEHPDQARERCRLVVGVAWDRPAAHVAPRKLTILGGSQKERTYQSVGFLSSFH